MLSRLFCLVALVFLTACGADHKWASDAEVAQARYVMGPPATLTLITSINGDTKAGAHSALLINGSERVLYDPAGSWELADGQAPERYDMHFGMFPGAVDNFVAFQSAGVFYVTEQTLEVPLAVADQAIAAAKAQGATPKALCANSTSTILGKLPGMEHLGRTFFPTALQREFAKLPGVVETRIDGTTTAPRVATN